MSREINIRVPWLRKYRSRVASTHFDAEIAALAARRRGCVSHRQLLALGMSGGAIALRVRAGRLHVLHVGVYAVGHTAITREGELVAGVLAGGEDAVLGYASAGELWEMPLPKDDVIHVIAPSHGKRPGIRFHKPALAASEITEHKGIRVTTPERTIIDIAATRPGVARLEQVIRHAAYEHLLTRESLTAAVGAHAGARGMKELREALNLSGESTGVTRSEMEKRFLSFTRRHRLPRPQLNYRIELPDRTVFADCAWPDQRLIVELDSRMAHHNDYAFEADRARDRGLLIAGWTTTRVTWRQLRRDEKQLAADLLALIHEINIRAA